MLQSEFEERFGMKVSPEEYTVIEKMYNNCNLDKDAFVKEYKRVGDSDLTRQLATGADAMVVVNSQNQARLSELACYIADRAEDHSDIDMRSMAESLMGVKAYLTYKLERGYELTKADTEKLVKLINK